jgi:hypothetical protein
MAAFIASPLHAQTIITDPAGDASGHPDVIAISGGYTRSNLYLTATFRSGSLNRTNLGFMFGLDTDLHPNTGVKPPASFPLGAEFSIFFVSASDTNNATVTDIMKEQAVGTVPVKFASDSLSLTVPLALLHSTNGKMNFGFVCGPAGPNGSFEPFDMVPDKAYCGPLGGPTSLIPELQNERRDTNTIVSRPTAGSKNVLGASRSLAASNDWTVVTNTITTVDSENTIKDTDPPKNKILPLEKAAQ